MTMIHTRAPASHRVAAISGLLLSLLLAASTAHAEDDKRSAQLREAAKRAQAATQQAQQELSTVKAERDQLAQAEKGQQDKLAQVQAQGRVAAGQAARLNTSLARATAERDQLKADLAREVAVREALAVQFEKSQATAQATTQALDEQRRSTQALSALLERSVKSLAAAEEANRQLQALGLQAVAAYEADTPVAVRARDEPFLGLAAVRLSGEAEALRKAMAAQVVTAQ
jgi:chromosome segregation ATPase